MTLRTNRDVARGAGLTSTILLLFALPAMAQSPTPLADPNLDLWRYGSVDAAVRLPDGSLIVGGDFSSVFDPGTQLNIERRNLAKFGPTGTLDFQWDPVADNRVHALALDVSGNVYVGGQFEHIDGQPRRSVARLSVSGSGQLDANWNAALDGFPIVRALATGPADTVYVGGSFDVAGGLQRDNIAKLSGATGATDPNWDPDAPGGTVERLLLAPDGTLIAAGSFSNIGGVMRNGLAKLAPDGTGAADPDWNPAPGGSVNSIALAADQTLVVGGDFATIGGQNRRALAKLALTGTGAADPAWNPLDATAGVVYAVGASSDGAVYAHGRFTAAGESSARILARFAGSAAGAIVPAWMPDVECRTSLDMPACVFGIVADGTSGVFLHGEFGRADGAAASSVARLSATDGSLVAALFAELPGDVEILDVAPDGSVYAAGRFSRANGFARGGLLKLGPDGLLDTLWDPAPNERIATIAATDSVVFVGGAFSRVGTDLRDGIARIPASGDGSADPAWNPAIDGEVHAIATADNDVFVASFTPASAGGPRHGLVKLSATGAGTADPAWSPSPNNTCTGLEIGPDGNLYAAGFFTMIGGQSRQRLARLSRTGTGAADPAWNAGGIDGNILDIAFDPAGLMYLSGTFDTVQGNLRFGVVRLITANGGLDPAWDAASDNFVQAVAVDARGDVFLAGEFTAMGGAPREDLAKVSGTTGLADPTWTPTTNSLVFDVAIGPNDVLHVAGDMTLVSNVPRRNLASLPAVVDLLLADGFEDP